MGGPMSDSFFIVFSHQLQYLAQHSDSINTYKINECGLNITYIKSVSDKSFTQINIINKLNELRQSQNIYGYLRTIEGQREENDNCDTLMHGLK